MKLFQSLNTLYVAGCRRLAVCAHCHQQALMLFAGLALVLLGIQGVSVADGEEYITYEGSGFAEVDDSYSNSNFTKLVRGAFGSLVMVVSGLGAFVAAAMGAYRAAAAMLALAIGAFIARGAISVMAGYDNVKYKE